MAQPVRKVIKDKHPELAETPIYTLIIDGTNLLRISFADTRMNADGIHYGGVFQFLLQTKLMLRKKNFDYVYVVFDNEDSGILRWELYHDYKANRDKNYAQHSQEGLSPYMKEYEANLKRMQQYIYGKQKAEKVKRDGEKYKNGQLDTLSEDFLDLNFDRERAILIQCLNELFVRWIMDEKTEGDDIISYYVHHKKPNEKVVIMSSDEDLTQLISDTVCIWNSRRKEFVTKDNFKEKKGYPHENVVIKKIFLGDDSDNIGKIDGLSEGKLLEMMPEMKERAVTVEEVKQRAQELIDERVKSKKKPLKVHENIVNGISRRNYDGDFYEINNKLINLDLPLLTKEAETEMKETMYSPIDPEGRNFENLYGIVMANNMTDLLGNSFSNFFADYKPLIEREKQRYQDWITQNP